MIFYRVLCNVFFQLSGKLVYKQHFRSLGGHYDNDQIAQGHMRNTGHVTLQGPEVPPRWLV